MSGFTNVDEMMAYINNPENLDILGHIDFSRFEYVGFDMDGIINKICANAVKARRTASELTLDMFHCVIVGLLKGNIRDDQMHRIKKSSSDRVRELIRFYDIPVRRNSTHKINSSSDTFTFVRSITCFPRLASTILHRCPNLVKDFHGSTIRTSELPACMKHSGFAVLIPRNCNDLVKSALLSAHIAYMIDLGRIINAREFKSVMISYEKQAKISEMAMLNSRPADDVRVAYLLSVGLFDIATFKTVVLVANELMRQINADEISEDAIGAALLSVVETMSSSDAGASSGAMSLLPNQSWDLDSLFSYFRSSDLVSLFTSFGSSPNRGTTMAKESFPSSASSGVLPSTSSGETSLRLNQNEDLLSLLKFGL